MPPKFSGQPTPEKKVKNNFLNFSDLTMYNVKNWIERSFNSSPAGSPSSTFPLSASTASSSPSLVSSSPPPIPPHSSEMTRTWTKQDRVLTTIAVLVTLGDGVEIYLPGVLTQKVACELGVSDIQEGILAVVLFFCYAIGMTTSAPILKRFGEKLTLLLSLYLSILFAVICAVVPNYYSLMISRALTGLCAGLNVCISGIYLAKNVSTKEILTQSLFLSEALAFPIGGAWVSFLGWLLLDSIDWRIFVLLTSIPLFVPPILILHFFTIEKQEEDSLEDSDKVKCSAANERSIPTENLGLMRNKNYSFPNFYVRVIKSSLFSFCNLGIGYGSIILVPWVMRSFKSKEFNEEKVDECTDTVHGNDFMILAVVTGFTNIIGRPIGYFLWKRVRFLILQSTVTATMVLCFAIILVTDSYIASVILLAVVKFCYSVQAVEMAMLFFDYDYFGTSGLEFGCVVTSTIGSFGAAAGTSLGAFLHPYSAVMSTLGIACVEIVVICFMKERF